MRKASCVAVCCSVFVLAPTAWGQARDPATAEALFRQGRQAMEAKNFRDACPRFARKPEA